MSSSTVQAEASISPIENRVPHPRANCIRTAPVETEAASVPAETVQAEATVASPSTWQRLKATQFDARRYGFIVVLSVLTVLSPMFLTLAFNETALRLQIAYGFGTVLGVVVGFVIVAYALCVAGIVKAMPKGAK